MRDAPIPEFGQLVQEYTERPGAYGLVLGADSKIAVVRVENEYYLPGGGIDPGESPEEALTREALEEAGMHIRIVSELGRANQTFYIEDMKAHVKKLGVFFLCELLEVRDKERVEKDHVLIWRSPEEAISDLSEYQGWMIRQFLNLP